MREILQEVIAAADRGEHAALASVVSTLGSLPMSRRARMLVSPGGAQIGTVGGGCLEAEVHAMASVAMKQGSALLKRFTLTETKAGAEGLNCGGTVEILIEPVGAALDQASTDVYRQALAAIEARDETVMATLIATRQEADGESGEVTIEGRCLVGWKGLRVGAGRLGGDPALTGQVVEEALAILGQDRGSLKRLEGGDAVYLETISAPPVVYLFGGGHVSLAVAGVARAAGFRIVVVDDRAAFSNSGRFPEADRTVVAPMETALAGLSIDRNSYIVAATRGHQHDEPVIEQALRTPAAYIGMLGSKRKVAIMWQRLRERGFSQEQLARVHAPIGLPIGGDSPGEIAVSIVAQMIQVRRS